MKKTLQITTHEMLTALRRPSFLFFAFGIPIIIILIFGGIRIYKDLSATSDSAATSQEEQEESPWKVEGFVDLTGIIATIPPDLPEGILIQFSDEASALAAVEDGSINAFYVIPRTYIEDGEFLYSQSSFSIFSSENQDWMMRWTLLYNLTGENMPLAARVWAPANTEVIDLSLIASNEISGSDVGIAPGCQTAGYDCDSNIFLRYLPTIFLVLFFMSILMASSLLIYSISLEKDNRVMEVLLVSVSPQELLNGKILGLGILGLIQLCVYLISMVVVLKIGGQTLSLPESFKLPIDYFVWGLVFFLLGYGLYAGLMAGAGALVPDMKSYSGASMVIASPLFLGYMAAIILSFDPNGLITTVLSLFPFTSPVVMIWRMVNGSVPTWQPITAVVLLAVTVWLVVTSVARMFLANELLSGKPFQVKDYIRLLIRSPQTNT